MNMQKNNQRIMRVYMCGVVLLKVQSKMYEKYSQVGVVWLKGAVGSERWCCGKCAEGGIKEWKKFCEPLIVHLKKSVSE